ncbi:hypothetical protein V8D89_009862 [Ganoderma adspersum]
MPSSNDPALEMPLTVLPVSQEETLGALLVGTFCTLMCCMGSPSINSIGTFFGFPPTTAMSKSYYFMAVSDFAQKEAFITHGLWSQSAIVLITQFDLGFTIGVNNLFAAISYKSGSLKQGFRSHLQQTSSSCRHSLLPNGVVNVDINMYSMVQQRSWRLTPYCFAATPVFANSLLSALNSRDPQKGPSIFDSSSYGRNLIQHMNHRAAAETWNVPQPLHDALDLALRFIPFALTPFSQFLCRSVVSSVDVEGLWYHRRKVVKTAVSELVDRNSDIGCRHRLYVLQSPFSIRDHHFRAMESGL